MNGEASCTDRFMKGYLLAAVAFILLFLLVAGCSDQPEGSGEDLPPPPTPAPRFTAGDILSKIGSQEEPLWLILGYDDSTDMYERAFVYKKGDGTWGYRKDTRTDNYPRAEMEKLYPVKVAHVKPALVPVLSGTVEVTGTPAQSGLAPELTAIAPDTGAGGVLVTTELTGKRFASGVTVTLAGANSPAITATDVRNTGNKITCVFNLIDAPTGKRDVIVTNPDGQSDILPDGFTINNPAPVIGGIEPYTVKAGDTVTITITGANFKTPSMVYFVKDGELLEGGNVLVRTTSQLTLVLAVPDNVATGTWGVIVRNVADNQNSTTIRKFVIRAA